MTGGRLQSRLDGLVLEPGDEGYDEARSVWNAMIDRRPRYVVRCASAADVAAAVRYATEHEMAIGVRCGGHAITGHAVPADGLMIDLRPLGGVTVDPLARQARVQGGALLGALDRATQAHGLATTAGNVSHTGVGGLTLGGGMGWLARRLGLACDNVVSFELVTAAGEVLRVDRTHHPDLFWGLRGGGGNFGVVTEFEFVLHPEPGHALSVEFRLPVSSASDAMRSWRDLGVDADRRATWNATISGSLVSLGFVWVGEPAAGAELADRLHAGLDTDAVLLQRIVVPLSYLELQTREDDVEGHALRRYWKGHYLSELDDAAIDAILARDGDDVPDVSLQAYGGAIADVPADETAFARRNTAYEFIAATRWHDPAEDDRRIAGARRYAGAVEPYAEGAYVNALSDDGALGIRRAYPAHHLARLRELKRQYDPANVFHLNQNIAPADV
ncbi:FAD-binding oxidoreductase [Agromyces aerolatus]|uniref:FAD-binding oxidoreductase n=1 Tax=Agromyces sp. LY-1074 TaxID=3074080 RepID=UPI002865B432|nr:MULTISPECIES: FAD-binding oxidoreductase [unclassified Agromyces]MDR5700134.1 FAD-binding oxidoreductase [Agromyces sp. LY-1074]MDR5706498.1 FAD-binding oxidoreductase [Agromyces sp. LY-1358]